MRTMDMLLIAAAAYFFLGNKQNDFENVGQAPYAETNYAALREPLLITTPSTTKEQIAVVTETLKGIESEGAPFPIGSSAIPAIVPATQQGLVNQYVMQAVSGADPKAITQEVQMASLPQAAPKTPEVVQQEIQSGIIDISTGGLSAQWTGTGFYNPFTGVTHIPTMYA